MIKLYIDWMMKYLSENVHFLMNAVPITEIVPIFTQKKYISTITISATKKEYIFIVPNILRLNWNMTPALMAPF